MVGPYRRLLKAITGRPAFRILVTDGDSMFNTYPAMARLAWKTASGSTQGESQFSTNYMAFHFFRLTSLHQIRFDGVLWILGIPVPKIILLPKTACLNE